MTQGTIFGPDLRSYSPDPHAVFEFINSVRAVRGWLPLTGIDTRDAVSCDPYRCVLALAVGSRIDAGMMGCRDEAEAQEIAERTGEPLVWCQDGSGVAVPYDVSDIAVLFDNACLKDLH